MTISWIRAERNSSSDESLEVVDVLVTKGATVSPHSAVIELEGAKAVFELEATAAGFFYPLVTPGEIVDVGAYIAAVSTEELAEVPTPPADLESPSSSGELEQKAQGFTSKVNVSDAARKLAEEHGIDLNSFVEPFITEQLVRSRFTSAVSAKPDSSLFITKVGLLGGGNGAIQLREAALTNSRLALVGVFDDSQNSLVALGVPTLGGLNAADILTAFSGGVIDGIAIAISTRMDLRKKWSEFAKENKIPLISVIHSGAFIAQSASIADGALIMDSARVGAFSTIQENVFLSAFVDVEHHCTVGANTTFGPGVFLSGGVHVGKEVVFGTQIAVEPSLSIGSNSVISSGSVITQNIPEGSIVKVEQVLRVRARKTPN